MKQEYIIYDWVILNGMKAAVRETYTDADDSFVYIVNDEEYKAEDLKGVPLTSEILEKNGWKLCYGFYSSTNEEGVVIRLSSQTGYVWDAYVGIRPLRSGINNVSDLQHLLFGLGINHEMEV